MPEQPYLKDMTFEFTPAELDKLLKKNREGNSRKIQKLYEYIYQRFSEYDSEIANLKRRLESYPMPPPQDDYYD